MHGVGTWSSGHKRVAYRQNGVALRKFPLAEEVARGTPEAMLEVRRQLEVLGIGDRSSIMHLAGDIEKLRSVAQEVLGDGFGNEAWFALVSVWRSSSFLGRQ